MACYAGRLLAPSKGFGLGFLLAFGEKNIENIIIRNKSFTTKGMKKKKISDGKKNNLIEEYNK